MPGQLLQTSSTQKKDKRVLVLFLFGLSLLIVDLIPLQKIQALTVGATPAGTSIGYSLTTERAGTFPVESGELSPRLAFFFNQSMAINLASRQDLSLLPGIGERLADRIVSFRERNGDLHCAQDLKLIPGIGEKMSARICSFVSFAQP